MANPQVVVVGSCMTDLVSYTTRLPKPGETIHGHRFSIGFGGKGANQCIAATRLGASTAMVAMVGDDSFGQNYLQNFRDNGVDISHVGVTKEAATGVAPIAVDDSGENCIIIVAGANLKMTKKEVEKAEGMIKSSSVLVCQGEITMEATLAALLMARKHNVKTLMNAAPADASLDPSIIQNSDVFCVNETEAEVLTSICIKNVKDAERAAEELLSRGCGSVIITLGGEGALYSTSQGHMHVSAEKVTPVDTTGAGDAFVGALAYYMASHSQLDMVEMIQRSCKVATVSVQAPGTQSSYPARDKLPNEIFA
ncbi:ribokinase-like [Penaeus japonicus]|uniref:ribokinase-like n=1 Tax=Penaeus japonicus TaxID=27405 RepID=UPI001C70B671|nr:ribokinase-like [Penaeus japonicus]XP_042890106.1 ribokinase-like [Penaeus japonicus]